MAGMCGMIILTQSAPPPLPLFPQINKKINDYISAITYQMHAGPILNRFRTVPGRFQIGPNLGRRIFFYTHYQKIVHVLLDVM